MSESSGRSPPRRSHRGPRRRAAGGRGDRGRLARTDAVEPMIGAFLWQSGEEAIAAAEAVDRRRAAGEPLGRLAGVPVALKDNLHWQAHPVTCGSRILEGYIAPYSATAVERLLAEDAVILGKTNLDEFAMGSSCENSALRSTRNPWRPGPGPRWFERWLGGGGGGRHGSSRARLRHRRLDSPARRPVRRGRPQTHLWPGVPTWAGRLRIVARPDRPAGADDPRCGAHPRGHRRPRPARRDFGGGSRAARPRPARRRRARPAPGRGARSRASTA